MQIPLLPVFLIFQLWLGGSWLVVGWLLAPVLPGGWFTVGALSVGLPLLTLPSLLVLGRGFNNGPAPTAAQRLFLLRPFWYLFLTLPSFAIAGIGGAFFGLPFGAPGTTGRYMLAAAAVFITCAVTWGYIGSRRLVVRHLECHHPDLPPGFDGLRLVQLSDLHVGPHTRRDHLARVAQAVEQASPDLIVYTGDQVDDFPADVPHLGKALGHLKAPLGVFAVAGNHDIYAGWDAVRRGLEDLGLRVLVNEAIPLERGGDHLWLAGTGDPAGMPSEFLPSTDVLPDLPATLAPIPEGAFSLALAHNPALWPYLAQANISLTLSGHTHHGQLSIPSLGVCVASLFLELAMGVHHRGKSLLYIHPGTNYWGIPFRIGALPEVAVMTLRRGNEVALREVPASAQS